MTLALNILLALTVVACGGPTITQPPTPSSSGQASDVDCGPFGADMADCLAIVSAARELLDPEAGSRAQVSATSADMAHVTFMASSGDRRSADVIINPVGDYVAVNPSFGPE